MQRKVWQIVEFTIILMQRDTSTNLKEKTIVDKNLHIRFRFAPLPKMGIFVFFPGKNSKVKDIVKIRLLMF